MAPTLRGHHLICLHFYNGEGYDREFIQNLNAVMRQVEAAGVEVSPGADKVCKSCPHLKDNTCSYSERAEEEIREMDEKALTLLNLTPGTKVEWNGIRELLPEIFSEWHTAYCKTCDWRSACEKNPLYRTLTSEISTKS